MKLKLLVIPAILVLLVVLILVYKRGYHGNTELASSVLMIRDGEPIPGKPAKLFETKRVYLSGSMFNLEDVIYAIGINGLLPGLRYSAMDFDDVICLNTEQLSQLEQLCDTWDVPMNGVVGEIEKKGWEAYCPVRDGFPMAGCLFALASMTVADMYTDYDGNPEQNSPTSPYNPDMIDKRISEDTDYLVRHPEVKARVLTKSLTDNDKLMYVQEDLTNGLSISIGANDLFAMYSSCNCCLFNYNGIQGDSGALAEIGNLGARGVPISVLKSQVTSDFGGANNPMPTMCATSTANVFPTVSTSTNPNSIYFGYVGALDQLEKKLTLLDKNQSKKSADANYNYEYPLPPLQQFWSYLGGLNYYMKHKSKKIPVNADGSVIYEKDYTDFWMKNVIEPAKIVEPSLKEKQIHKGWINVAKKCGENVFNLKKNPKWNEVVQYWK